MNTDTICAVTTGIGSGAVAIVRLSGPEAWAAVIKLAARELNPTPYKMYLLNLYDGALLLDKALVTFFKGPKSFTGEDVAEIACHGSPYIKGRLLELLANLGVRPAKNGEFSYRAFTNGKMDMPQAQGLCDLIAAGNKAAHGAAMNSMEGKLSDKFKIIKTDLCDLLAQIEVRLDDVDEEMDDLPPGYARGVINNVLAQTSALAGTFSTGKLIKEGIKAAIVGLPNAGKSSLLNALLGYERAIVSEECGTTRDTVEDAFDHNGNKIIITDTAGVRAHAVNFAEKRGIERSLAAAQKSDIILFTADTSQPLSAEDKELWAEIKALGKKTILVCNKNDIAYTAPVLDGADGTVRVSSLSGAGVAELKDNIIKQADMSDVDLSSSIITSAVQYDMLLKTGKELQDALCALDKNLGLEFAAEHLRRALLHLKEIIGEVYADDILGIIFSKFCVGK